MIPVLELRPRQAALIEKIQQAFRAGHKRIMVSAPCGFGKTEVAVAILAKAHENRKAGAFICDRIALVDQTSARFDKYRLDHGVMQADHWRYRPSQLLQVCSIQTLLRRQWPDVSLMVIDEAHVLPESVRKKLDRRDCYAIGLSATPVTPGLGRYFDVVVTAATTNELITEGWLTPYDIWAPSEPDMTGVKVVAGEWEEKETSQRALQIVGDCVTEYLKRGNDRKFIAFAVDVAHAQELARQFCDVGIRAATYTYRDSDQSKADTITEFRKPNSMIRGVISIESLTRGFDVADVGVLILARPLRKALAVHLQMLGRVLRTAEGKERATILDHAGNCTRFWEEMEEYLANGVTELDDGVKKPKEKKALEEGDEPSLLKCPQCAHLHRPMPRCPCCGFERAVRTTVQHVAGTLKELIAGGNREKITAELWPQLVTLAREKYTDPKRGERWAKAKHQDIAKVWPSQGYATAPTVPISEYVRNQAKASDIRYHRAKAAETRRNKREAELV